MMRYSAHWAALGIPPPLDADDWGAHASLERSRTAARQLIGQFTGHGLWGWKDPRSSLTAPFWMDLIPGLRFVICVRNPLEVALSLRKRWGFSLPLSINLWRAYNACLLAAVPPERRIVTHYDAYFAHAETEVRRVLDALNIAAPAAAFERARAAVAADLRSTHFAMRDLLDAGIAGDAIALYASLCAEAGWSDTNATTDRSKKKRAAWDSVWRTVGVDPEEQRAAQQHREAVERDQTTVRAHLARVEQDRDSIRAYLEDSERERRGVREYLAEVESDRAALRGHLTRARAHLEDVERDRANLREHLTLVERDRADVRAYLADVEQDRTSVRAYLEGVERDRANLREHLERIEWDRAEVRTYLEDVERDRRDVRALLAAVEADDRAVRAHLEAVERDRTNVRAYVADVHREYERMSGVAATHAAAAAALEATVQDKDRQIDQLHREMKAVRAQLNRAERFSPRRLWGLTAPYVRGNFRLSVLHGYIIRKRSRR